jgi:hypothetical protein
MKPSTKPSHGRHVSFEPLERRQLLSGTLNTVYSDPNGLVQSPMAADKSGNDYAINQVNGGSDVVSGRQHLCRGIFLHRHRRRGVSAHQCRRRVVQQ